MLLHQAIPQPLGGPRESLRGAPARFGHGPDAPTPQSSPLGRLPGFREVAAAGAHSSYTNLLFVCLTDSGKSVEYLQHNSGYNSYNKFKETYCVFDMQNVFFLNL